MMVSFCNSSHDINDAHKLTQVSIVIIYLGFMATHLVSQIPYICHCYSTFIHTLAHKLIQLAHVFFNVL